MINSPEPDPNEQQPSGNLAEWDHSSPTTADPPTSDQREKKAANYRQYAKYVMRPLKAVGRSIVGVVNWLDSKDGFVTAIATVLIAILTGYYVHYAKAQWKAMEGQLTEMQRDQRAWVSVSATQPIFPSGDEFSPPPGPVTASIEIKNTGKTPAFKVEAVSRLETFWPRSGESPHFDYKSLNPTGRLTQGIGPIGRISIPSLAPNAIVVLPLTEQLNQQSIMESTRSTTAVHGELRYCDVFHERHWVNFCLQWNPAKNAPNDLSQYVACEGIPADRNSLDDVNTRTPCQ